MSVSLLWSPARISFPIFPSGHPDRGPDLAPCHAPRRSRRACLRARLPGLHRADPSTPLDERYAVVSQTRQEYSSASLGGTTPPDPPAPGGKSFPPRPPRPPLGGNHPPRPPLGPPWTPPGR